MCYIIKKAKRKVREEKQDGVFKSVFYLSVFAVESDFIFYIVQQNLALWGAVGFFPLFLCVGRAEVCDSDACFDRAELFLWIVDWEDAE